MKIERLPPIDFSINEGIHARNFNMEFHTHDFMEIGYILGGRGRYEIYSNNKIKRIPASPETFFLWTGKIPHRSVDENVHDPLHQIILCFSKSFLKNNELCDSLDEELTPKEPFQIRYTKSLFTIRELLLNLLTQRESKEIHNDLLMRFKLSEIIIRALRDSRQKANIKTDERVGAIIHYLKSNYHKQLALKQFTGPLELSERRLRELFKETTGLQFSEYLNRYRVSLAERFIKENHSDLTTIAFKLGFESLSYFNRIFKKYHHKSPSYYRLAE